MSDLNLSFNDDVQVLRTNFRSGISQPLDWRKEQLRQLQKLLQNHEADLLQALQKDLGKHHAEGWSTELGFLHRDIRYAVKNLSRWAKAKRVSQPLVAWPGKSYIRPEALGVVCILGAWNYPVQLLLSPLVAALAAGNCAVIKPSELAPATADLMAKLIPDYLSPHAVKVVTGGPEVAAALLQQRFDHIFYTGGARVGRIVMEAASKHLTPVTLELGGKSPTVVLADADIQVAARRIVWGKWLNAGQTCIAPDYLLIATEIYDAFVEALIKELNALYGDDISNNKDYGRIVNTKHWQRLQNYLQQGHIIHGGDTRADDRYIAPTLIEPADDSVDIMQEEIFGPILPLRKIRNLAEAIDYIESNEKPLALYGFTKSQKSIAQLERVAAGNQCFNDTLMFMLNHELPFGGVGESGMGAYHGYSGFVTFSHMKSVMHRGNWPDPNFRYPPYTTIKNKIMRFFTGGSKSA